MSEDRACASASGNAPGSRGGWGRRRRRRPCGRRAAATGGPWRARCAPSCTPPARPPPARPPAPGRPRRRRRAAAGPPPGRAACAVSETSSLHTSRQQHPHHHAPEEQQARQRQLPHPGGGGLRHLQVAHHRQRSEPGGAEERGQDQQPLHQPDGAGPHGDPLDAQVGGGQGAVEPVTEVGQPATWTPAAPRRPTAWPGRRTRRRRARAPRCPPGPARSGAVWGREVRDRPDSCLPAAPRSRCSRLSGSGLSRESHEVTGQPVARPARIRVDRSTASTTVGTPGGLGERVVERGHPLVRERAGPRGAARPRRAGRPTARRSASIRCRVTFLADTRRAISAAQLLDPDAVPGADRDHRDVGEPVQGEQAADVVEHRLAPRLRHGVDVVEHDQHHVLVAGQRREVAVVDRGVGVLLRVEHPDQQVGELHEPVHLEVVGHLGGVVVGQVEQDHARRSARPRPGGGRRPASSRG